MNRIAVAVVAGALAFPIIAQTKAITQTLDEVRQQVAQAWPGETDAE